MDLSQLIAIPGLAPASVTPEAARPLFEGNAPSEYHQSSQSIPSLSGNSLATPLQNILGSPFRLEQQQQPQQQQQIVPQQNAQPPNAQPSTVQSLNTKAPTESRTTSDAGTKIRFLVAVQYVRGGVRGGVRGSASTSRPYKVLCIKDSTTYEEFLEILCQKLNISKEHTEHPIADIQLETGDMGVAVSVEDADSYEYAIELGISYSWSKDPLRMRVYAEAVPSPPPKKITSIEAEELIRRAAAAAKKPGSDHSAGVSTLCKREETASPADSALSSRTALISSLIEEGKTRNTKQDTRASFITERDANSGTSNSSSTEYKSENSKPSSPNHKPSSSTNQSLRDSNEKLGIKLAMKLDGGKSSARGSHDDQDKEILKAMDRRRSYEGKEYDPTRDDRRISDCYRPGRERERERDRRERTTSTERGRGRRDSRHRGRHRSNASASPRRDSGLYSDRLQTEMQNRKRSSSKSSQGKKRKGDELFGPTRGHLHASASRMHPQATTYPIMSSDPMSNRPYFSPVNKWSPVQPNPNSKNGKAPKSVAYIATRCSASGGDWIKYQLRNTGGPDVKIRMRDAGQFGAEWGEVLGPLAEGQYSGMPMANGKPHSQKSPGLIMIFFRTRPVQQGISGFGCDVRGEVSMTFNVEGFEPGSFHYTIWNNYDTGEQFLTIRFTINNGSGYVMRGFSGNSRQEHGDLEWNSNGRTDAHISYNSGMGSRMVGQNGTNLQRLTGHLLNCIKSGKHGSKMQVTFSIGTNDGCWDLLPFLQKHGAMKLDRFGTGPHGSTGSAEIPPKAPVASNIEA